MELIQSHKIFKLNLGFFLLDHPVLDKIFWKIEVIRRTCCCIQPIT